MAKAVATCSATTKARYGDSFAVTLRSLAHCPPMSAGISTLCPRLEIGKSSDTPCTSPVTIASAYVRCDISQASFPLCRGIQGTEQTRGVFPVQAAPDCATRMPNDQSNAAAPFLVAY